MCRGSPQQPALRLAFVDELVAGVGDEVAVLLVLVPGIMAPVVRGRHPEGLLAHHAPLEVLQRVIEAAPHAEGREVRARVGHEAGPGVDGRREGGDVREAAEDLGGGPDQVVVRIPEEPVAVVATQGGEHAPDARVRKGLVQVGDTPPPERTRTGPAPRRSWRTSTAARAPPTAPARSAAALPYEPEAGGRRDDPDLVAPPELDEYHRHPSSKRPGGSRAPPPPCARTRRRSIPDPPQVLRPRADCRVARAPRRATRRAPAALRLGR